MIDASATRRDQRSERLEQSRPVRIGLIGYGRIAQAAQERQMRRLLGARLVPQAHPCAGYADLLAQPDLDAVVICLPPALHAVAAIAAFHAGKHVYLEKSLATELDAGAAVLAT